MSRGRNPQQLAWPTILDDHAGTPISQGLGQIPSVREVQNSAGQSLEAGARIWRGSEQVLNQKGLFGSFFWCDQALEV